MVNVWKVSTLVLAGALAVVVGRGAVRESSACDTDVELPSAEQQTRLKLARGLAFLERADQEVSGATAARPKERADALVQIAKARASIELALAPVVEQPRPRPRPRPMRAADVADPFATPPPLPPASTERTNPFLRGGTTTASVSPDGVLDPWARKRDPLSVRR